MFKKHQTLDKGVYRSVLSHRTENKDMVQNRLHGVAGAFLTAIAALASAVRLKCTFLLCTALMT